MPDLEEILKERIEYLRDEASRKHFVRQVCEDASKSLGLAKTEEILDILLYRYVNNILEKPIAVLNALECVECESEADIKSFIYSDYYLYEVSFLGIRYKFSEKTPAKYEPAKKGREKRVIPEKKRVRFVISLEDGIRLKIFAPENKNIKGLDLNITSGVGIYSTNPFNVNSDDDYDFDKMSLVGILQSDNCGNIKISKNTYHFDSQYKNMPVIFFSNKGKYKFYKISGFEGPTHPVLYKIHKFMESKGIMLSEDYNNFIMLALQKFQEKKRAPQVYIIKCEADIEINPKFDYQDNRIYMRYSLAIFQRRFEIGLQRVSDKSEGKPLRTRLTMSNGTDIILEDILDDNNNKRRLNLGAIKNHDGSLNTDFPESYKNSIKTRIKNFSGVALKIAQSKGEVNITGRRYFLGANKSGNPFIIIFDDKNDYIFDIEGNAIEHYNHQIYHHDKNIKLKSVPRVVPEQEELVSIAKALIYDIKTRGMSLNDNYINDYLLALSWLLHAMKSDTPLKTYSLIEAKFHRQITPKPRIIDKTPHLKYDLKIFFNSHNLFIIKESLVKDPLMDVIITISPPNRVEAIATWQGETHNYTIDYGELKAGSVYNINSKLCQYRHIMMDFEYAKGFALFNLYKGMARMWKQAIKVTNTSNNMVLAYYDIRNSGKESLCDIIFYTLDGKYLSKSSIQKASP